LIKINKLQTIGEYLALPCAIGLSEFMFYMMALMLISTEWLPLAWFKVKDRFTMEIFFGSGVGDSNSAP
jgi:hypothetical protein